MPKTKTHDHRAPTEQEDGRFITTCECGEEFGPATLDESDALWRAHYDAETPTERRFDAPVAE